MVRLCANSVTHCPSSTVPADSMSDVVSSSAAFSSRTKPTWFTPSTGLRADTASWRSPDGRGSSAVFGTAVCRRGSYVAYSTADSPRCWRAGQLRARPAVRVADMQGPARPHRTRAKRDRCRPLAERRDTWRDPPRVEHPCSGASRRLCRRNARVKNIPRLSGVVRTCCRRAHLSELCWRVKDSTHAHCRHGSRRCSASVCLGPRHDVPRSSVIPRNWYSPRTTRGCRT